MKLYALVRSSRFILLTSLAVAFGAQYSVYANKLESNQCTKLLEAHKHKLSFKDFVGEKIKKIQLVESQKSEEQNRLDIENSQLRDMDQLSLSRKIKFISVAPRKFFLNEFGFNLTEAEITKPYFIMDAKMTQMMYAQFMILFGIKDFERIFPSHFKVGDNAIIFNYNGFKVFMRPDDPVTNVSWNEIHAHFLPSLNAFSLLDNSEIQDVLKKLIPDHQKADVYDLVTQAQLVNVMQLTKTESNEFIDEIIRKKDQEKLKKYLVFDQNSDETIGTYPVSNLSPLFFNDTEIFLHGNVWEILKDRWDGVSPFQGGQDPLSYKGSGIYVCGGGWKSTYNLLSSDVFAMGNPELKSSSYGFRLVRISRVGIHNKSGGVP